MFRETFEKKTIKNVQPNFTTQHDDLQLTAGHTHRFLWSIMYTDKDADKITYWSTINTYVIRLLFEATPIDAVAGNDLVHEK